MRGVSLCGAVAGPALRWHYDTEEAELAEGWMNNSHICAKQIRTGKFLCFLPSVKLKRIVVFRSWPGNGASCPTLILASFPPPAS